MPPRARATLFPDRLHESHSAAPAPSVRALIAATFEVPRGVGKGGLPVSCSARIREPGPGSEITRGFLEGLEPLLCESGAFAYFGGSLGGTAVGMAAALVGLVANGSSSLLGRHINRDPAVSPLVVTALSMAIGVAILVPTSLVVEGPPSLSGRAVVLIVWLAVVNTALAFTLWNLALQHLGAVASAAINNTMLIQIAVLAWVFLDEPIGVSEGLGIVLVTIGVLLSQTARIGPRALRRADRGQ